METQTFSPKSAIAQDSRIRTKWRDGALLGFVGVPDALLSNQGTLKLTPTEMVVLLNILSYWWFEERKPFPRTSVIARRMGTTSRTVQRALENLGRKNILVKDTNSRGARIFDPTPLVEKVERLARKDVRFPAKGGT